MASRTNISLTFSFLPTNATTYVASSPNEHLPNLEPHGNKTGNYNEHDYESTVYESFLHNLQTNSSVFGIILSAWTLIVNVLVIYCCVKDKITRSDVFYIQIVNFSVSNILICIFVLPLTVYYILHPWDLGYTVCKLWIIFDLILPFASVITLLLLNIDRVLLMTHPNSYACIFQKCLSQLIVMTPWLVALSIVVPLWTSGTLPYTHIPGECVVIVNTNVAMLCPVITYFIPLVALVALTLENLILRWNFDSFSANGSTEKYSMKGTESHTHSVHNGNEHFLNENERNTNVEVINKSEAAPADTVISICLINLFFLGMWFPFQCVSFLLSICTSQTCVPSLELNQVVTWTGAASAGVAPMFWFVDRNIRTRLMSLCGCRKESSNTAADSTNINDETFL